MGTTLPAGWYADPADKSQYRYWSGEGWTTHVQNRAKVDIAAAEADVANRPLPDFDALDEPDPPVRAPRRRVPVAVAVLALVAVVATAGFATFGSESESGHRLTGEVRVAAPSVRGQAHQAGGFTGDGSTCGTGGAPGIGDGTRVKVMSARGDELGTTELGEGRVDETLSSTTCVFTYEVDGLDDAGVYIVQVGNRRAGRATREHIEEAGWHLDVRLG